MKPETKDTIVGAACAVLLLSVFLALMFALDGPAMRTFFLLYACFCAGGIVLALCKAAQCGDRYMDRLPKPDNSAARAVVKMGGVQ